ncbi:hypothetical protein EJ03DRAFT_353493 [Teratosphaeria nubilosa]|uniref:Uncharacterized protein n=1 Tax=Teratosphaeria nubilosa TaxID=161662 RepID=A0A6G1L2M8_9PEZI|nr:hypothetical protein EJ03DRAFT_353493 [Teratosphaeria nubilosa]
MTHMAAVAGRDKKGQNGQAATHSSALAFVIALQGIVIIAGLLLALLGLFSSDNSSKNLQAQHFESEHLQPPLSLFVFGDSYSASAFTNGSDAPSLHQPLGFPPLDPAPDHLNWTKHTYIIGIEAVPFALCGCTRQVGGNALARAAKAVGEGNVRPILVGQGSSSNRLRYW